MKIQDNQILFTDKEQATVYKTGRMGDPGLVDRLNASGAQFYPEIIEETSPLTPLLLYWILPIVNYLYNPAKYQEIGASKVRDLFKQATEIDRQVVALVKEQHQKAVQILMDNREKLDELSIYLYEKETITGEEFMNILKT